MNCPPLLLPLPCDQRVRMPVNVHARSFPATIRETSSRPNRHPRHRGSHSDDNSCRISTLSNHFPLVVKNRSEAAPRAFHSAFPNSVQGREAAPAATGAPLRLCSGVTLGRPLANSPAQNVNQLTIDIIRYILSQCYRPADEAM